MFYLWSFRWNSNRVNVQPQFHPEDTPMNAGIATCRSLIPLSCDRILDPESCPCVKHVIKPNNDITLNSFWGKCPHQKVWMNEEKNGSAQFPATQTPDTATFYDQIGLQTGNLKVTWPELIAWNGRYQKANSKRRRVIGQTFTRPKDLRQKRSVFPFLVEANFPFAFKSVQMSILVDGIAHFLNLNDFSQRKETGNYWANPAI